MFPVLSVPLLSMWYIQYWLNRPDCFFFPSSLELFGTYFMYRVFRVLNIGNYLKWNVQGHSIKIASELLVRQYLWCGSCTQNCKQNNTAIGQFSGQSCHTSKFWTVTMDVAWEARTHGLYTFIKIVYLGARLYMYFIMCNVCALETKWVLPTM